MFGGIFKSKNLIIAENNQKILENEIKKISTQILRKDAFLKCKNNIFVTKEDVQKNSYVSERLEEEIKKYEEENILLKKEINKIENILVLNSIQNRYLVRIDKFLPETRFIKVLKLFKASKILYIQSLNQKLIENLVTDEKLKKEIIKRYENFLNDIMTWNVKTNLIKGERITKVFNKYKKIVNILSNQSILYMDEVTDAKIDEFIRFDCSLEEIGFIKKRFNNYKAKYLLK